MYVVHVVNEMDAKKIPMSSYSSVPDRDSQLYSTHAAPFVRQYFALRASLVLRSVSATQHVCTVVPVSKAAGDFPFMCTGYRTGGVTCDRKEQSCSYGSEGGDEVVEGYFVCASRSAEDSRGTASASKASKV